MKRRDSSLEKRCVLFVDDDRLVLEGLKRQMRPLRKRFRLLFANSGEEALSILAEEEVDVIVTDLRMPGMDGASLLEEVKERYPGTMRVVLTGQASQEATMRVLKAAHQFLDKPCEAKRLYAVLDRALFIKRLMNHPPLEALVGGMETLPSLPESYARIERLLEDPESSVDDVAEVVAQDVAISAKLLQLVNSAFFGHFQQVDSPQKAVHLLGLETVKSLVLSLHLFSQLNRGEDLPISVEGVWEHSLWVAATAKGLTLAEGLGETEADCAFLAGLLHDVGKVILAINLPERYRESVSGVPPFGDGLYQAEREGFGVGHPEVGAYLMGLWGLPGPVIEAIAYHHRPERYPADSFDSFTAVYAANILDHELGVSALSNGMSTSFNMEYLQRIGCDTRLETWRNMVRRAREEGDHEEG